MLANTIRICPAFCRAIYWYFSAKSTVPRDDNDNMSSSSLSAGALAGIGVGIAAVVVVFVALIIWCCIRYMRQGEEKRVQSVQSVYSTSKYIVINENIPNNRCLLNALNRVTKVQERQQHKLKI